MRPGIYRPFATTARPKEPFTVSDPAAQKVVDDSYGRHPEAAGKKIKDTVMGLFKSFIREYPSLSAKGRGELHELMRVKRNAKTIAAQSAPRHEARSPPPQ